MTKNISKEIEKIDIKKRKLLNDLFKSLENETPHQITIAIQNLNKNDLKKYFKEIENNEKLIISLLGQLGWFIRHIENPTEKMKLEAVKKDGLELRYIKNPSKKIQLAAVKNFGTAIQFIENPSKEVQLAAVKKNDYALKYIKNPDKEVIKEAEVQAKNKKLEQEKKNKMQEI